MLGFLEQIINALLLGCNYALIAIGFSLFFGALNVVHFSHGDVCILGSFVFIILYMLAFSVKLFNVLPPCFGVLVLIAATVVITGILGMLFEKVVIKPFRNSNALMPLVATVALGLIIRETIRLFYPEGSNPQIFPDVLPQGYFDISGFILRYDNLIILFVTFAVITLLFFFIRFSSKGRAIRAVSQDTEAAMMMGIRLDSTIAMTFLIGSGLGALAGILNGAYISLIRFDMGLMSGVKGWSAATIGGLGNIYGAIIGGFLFGFVETFACAYVPGGTAYKDVFAFSVVIFFLIFRPSGILGEKVYEKV